MVLEIPLWAPGPEGDEFQHSALLDRRLIDAAFGVQGGVFEHLDVGSLRVTERAAGANMSVDIAPGTCNIPGTSTGNQGGYICRSTEIENRSVAAAPGSGSRTDLVVARIRDSSVSGAQDGFFIEVLSGTTTVPDDAIELARITVPSGTASVTDSMISDTRSSVSLARFNGLALEHIETRGPLPSNVSSVTLAPSDLADYRYLLLVASMRASSTAYENRDLAITFNGVTTGYNNSRFGISEGTFIYTGENTREFGIAGSMLTEGVSTARFGSNYVFIDCGQASGDPGGLIRPTAIGIGNAIHTSTRNRFFVSGTMAASVGGPVTEVWLSPHTTSFVAGSRFELMGIRRDRL